MPAISLLEGEDFVKTFRLDADPDPEFMPLFAESVRIDRVARRPESELVMMSMELWRRHLKRVPATNPIERFATRFERDLPHMHQRGLEYYHAWAFATTRQLGAAFELAALNLRWLRENGIARLDEAIDAFESISMSNKTFILKGARAVNARRQFDGESMFSGLSQNWQRGMESLKFFNTRRYELQLRIAYLENMGSRASVL